MLNTLFYQFFFNDPSTTEIYTLSLHDALPILDDDDGGAAAAQHQAEALHLQPRVGIVGEDATRSEEHTSELQSHVNLVCRLLLEKKKKKKTILNRIN